MIVNVKNGFFQEFEKLIESKYEGTMKSKTIQFRFHSCIKYVSTFTANQFLVWVLMLLKKGEDDKRKKTIKITYDKLNESAHKKLIITRIFDYLRNLGVEAPFESLPKSTNNYPLTIIKDRAEIDDCIENIIEHFNTSPSIKFLFKEHLSTIIKEVLENSFNHSPNYSYPYIFVLYTQADNPFNNVFFAKYPKEIAFLDICFGDIGPGIIETIKNNYPSNYKPSFKISHELTPDENVLLYAFEFSSTGNSISRQNRINQLLKTSGYIDSNQIASGLYTILNTIKLLEGQFILKTNKQYVNFNYYVNDDSPKIITTNSMDNKIKYVANLPGSHYQFRIPIKPIKKYFVGTNCCTDNIKFQKCVMISPIAGGELYSPTEEQLINYLVEEINKCIYSHNEIIGLIIDLNGTNISSKGEQIIYNILLHQNHNNITPIVLKNNNSYVQIGTNINTLFPNSYLLIGSILENKFIQVGFQKSMEIGSINSNIELNEELWKIINIEYNQTYIKYFSKVFNTKDIKHTDGYYLFDLKYYTQIFYQIEVINKQNTLMEIIAVYIARMIHVSIKIIFLEFEMLKELALKIAYYHENYYNNKLEIITDINKYQSFESYPLDSNSIILTDVICTANNIVNLVSRMYKYKPKLIFTLIDARNDEGVDLFNSSENIEILSLSKEYIKTYTDLDQKEQNKKQIILVDKKTRKPTIPYRYKIPEMKVEYTIQNAQSAKALYIGHYEFLGKHYGYYIHFSNFFLSIRKDLEKWLEKQIHKLIKKNSNPSSRMIFCIYNDREEIKTEWITEKLREIIKMVNCEIRYINSADILYPPPRDQNEKENNNWVLIIPAITSGDTQQRFIEYASRFNPHSISLLCLISRMNPTYATFFSGIEKYRKSKINLEIFLQFPIKSYRGSSSECPFCSYRKKIQLIDSTRYYEIKELIDRKEKDTREIQIGNGDDSYEKSRCSISYIKCNQLPKMAIIRSLYSLAEYDIFARKELKKIIQKDMEAPDLFIKIVSLEYDSFEFDNNNIQLRLYEAYETVVEYSKRIISGDIKSPISHYIFGIEKIIPNSIKENYENILKNNIDSRNEVEEIILAMVLLNINPKNVEYLNKLLDDPRYSALIKDFLEYCRFAKGDVEKELIEFLHEMQYLYTIIFRSSRVFTGLESFLMTLEEESLKDCRDKYNIAYKNWQQTDSILKNIKNSRYYETTNKQLDLDKYIKEMNDHYLGLYTLINEGISISKEVKEQIIIHFNRIVELRNNFHGLYYNKIVVNPSRIELNEQIQEQNLLDLASDLKIHTDITYKEISQVYFNMDNLNYIVKELLDNCEKAQRDNHSGTYVMLRIRNDHPYIIIELEDDISGEYDTRSTGATNDIMNICKDFGAKIEYERYTIPKKVKIYLMKWPKNFGGNNE